MELYLLTKSANNIFNPLTHFMPLVFQGKKKFNNSLNSHNVRSEMWRRFIRTYTLENRYERQA